MFTGIVEEVGRLRVTTVGRERAEFEIDAVTVLSGTRVGDSIAVAGVCLTVTRCAADRFWADAMPETLRRSTLGGLDRGAPLNLERALTLGSRLGGHLVTGHIDGVGHVRSVRPEGNASVVTVSVPDAVTAVTVAQGSVAVDGVSLTVVEVGAGELRVSLIPHTVAATTLSGLSTGAEVNIETDLIGKYVAAFVRRAGAGDGLTWDKLSEAGFV
jgi:riboflavin synthase